MTQFLIDNMAPIMFGSLVVFLLSGFPIAFALAANGLLFAFIGIELGLLPPELLQALPSRLFGIIENDTLLAIPFFTFMGLILERSGMAEDLLDTIGQLFGPIRGGLAYAVIFVGALLAATTGVVAASVISMGLISLPLMLKYNYDKRLATGVIAASGTLAQIIPPSLVLIVLADQLGRSVGDMYKGAFVPGMVLTGLYMGYVLLVTLFKPAAAPALPLEARTFREPSGKSGSTSVLVLTALAVVVGVVVDMNYNPGGPLDERLVVSIGAAISFAFVLAVINRVLKLNLLSQMAEKVTFVLIPPLALIFLVLGTIFIGVATPTEGGGMGALGALVLALIKGRLNLGLTRQAMESTLKLSAFVIFILIGARVFSLTFYGVDGHLWVEHLLTALPGGQTGFLIAVNVLFFLLAFFLDFFELAFILVPLVGPVADKLGIDLIWFGVLLAVNMQTSFMHPPFGFSLFYLRSVAPRSVKTSDIYWGSVPFVVIQLIMVSLIIIFPGLVTTDKTKAQDRSITRSLDIDFGTTTQPAPGGTAPSGPSEAPEAPTLPGGAQLETPSAPGQSSDSGPSAPVFEFEKK
ncbi:TRAP-type mannitol/chloroaromatic compound transport system, large permease component [Cupriavidus gilardii CR3]|uniref:TRAP transporter large permease subunit n=1 Tax=Cupriavidus gilardii TaxID=82541 RepID=A0A849B2L1_9BURK|nr:TRAP transporter large permease subunit [Cupriavidus gilardii]ALD89728.1 TRAP-type mannitol/chloroaromatic compound transport system, large permease component [Cupriavidus gilardii CR3]KAB0598875.1 TRAP transporter large permease subunit [Cupriavidus gilardii]MCT9015976.1 TRAP transporter large permease subunit [Cupriavidus gilardii]MCT9055746.1 TRAP transporter large permease subunit [Cupriavidus gilardii]NNH09680.1 TRAP transporter large permease subunit [Cupriavidus gilardii]